MDKTISLSDNLYLKWKSKCGRYTVLISHSCFKKMLEMTKIHYPKEVGSSLVGCYSDNGFDSCVLDMAPLCPDSKSSTTFFYRGIKGLRKFYIKLWQSYMGEIYYVGEWHNHPNGIPIPSNTDDISQTAVAADNRVNCPENILVIVGGNLPCDQNLGVFVYSRRLGRIDLFQDEI